MDETTVDHGHRKHDHTDYTAAEEDNSDEHTALIANSRKHKSCLKQSDYLERASQSYYDEQESRGRSKYSHKSGAMSFGAGRHSDERRLPIREYLKSQITSSSLTGSSGDHSKKPISRHDEESRMNGYTYDAKDSDEYGNETTYYRDTPRKVPKGHTKG
jgi:hypothetical protein